MTAYAIKTADGLSDYYRSVAELYGSFDVAEFPNGWTVVRVLVSPDGVQETPLGNPFAVEIG